MDNADTVSDTYTVTGNGIVLTSVATGGSAYELGLNLVLTDDNATNCDAETPTFLAALIQGSSPNFTLTCDLNDDTCGTCDGFNPVRGTRLVAAMAEATANTFGIITAAAEGTGIDTLPAGTLTLSDIEDIEPGDTIDFFLPSSAIADSDTDTAQDTITMHICDASTTAFDYSANTCTGGTKLCSSSAVDPTSAVATCDDTQSSISVPTANAAYTMKVYAEDSHNFPATGTESQTYIVADVAPTLSGYSTSDSLSISAGLSDDLTYAVTILDDNGDNDITDIDFVLFEDTSVNDDCSADDNDCIRIDNQDPSSLGASCSTSTLSTPGAGKTADGTDNSLTVSCDFTAWFNATAGSNWEVSATFTDVAGPVNGADSNDNNVIAALSGIGVKSGEDTITYGTVALGAVSSVDTVTIENLGNQTNDTLISGADMCTDYPTCSGSQIDSTQQEFNPDTNTWTWGAGGDAGYALVNVGALGTTTATGCVNRDMVVRNSNSSGADSDEPFYHAIKIPLDQDSGSYTGVNTFTTTAGSTCDTEPLYNSYD
jgi:hypothetical protein